jgi:hypothetical protein
MLLSTFYMGLEPAFHNDNMATAPQPLYRVAVVALSEGAGKPYFHSDLGSFKMRALVAGAVYNVTEIVDG